MKEINTKDMNAVQGGNGLLKAVIVTIIGIVWPVQTGKDSNEK